MVDMESSLTTASASCWVAPDILYRQLQLQQQRRQCPDRHLMLPSCCGLHPGHMKASWTRIPRWQRALRVAAGLCLLSKRLSRSWLTLASRKLRHWLPVDPKWLNDSTHTSQ